MPEGHVPCSWRRESEFRWSGEKSELWRGEVDGKRYAFEVRCTFGKPTNMAGLKQSSPFAGEMERNRRMREYFETRNDFQPVDRCPVCSHGSQDAAKRVSVWRATYLQCRACDHAYTDLRPSDRVLTEYYEATRPQGDFYVRPEEIDLRLKEIYLPKADWILAAYTATFGRAPRSILDLGAGSGHFLEACRRRGLSVAGFEIDAAQRKWCRENFGIDLASSGEELRRRETSSFDVVTSFNVIEHTIQPHAFLDLYRSFSGPETLQVIETPRFNSFILEWQKHFPQRVREHIVPYQHVHLFTDSSLATLMVKHGISIRHAWFFGQDAREVLFQLSSESPMDVDTLMRGCYTPLQQVIDLCNASNIMVLAGVRMTL